MNILVHYFKRAFTRLLDLTLVLGIPLGFIALVPSAGDVVNGYNINLTVTALFMILSFQFFGTWLVFHFLFTDIKGDMRFRLKASPHSVNKFVLSAVIVGWLYSLITGGIVIAVSAVIFDIYWGNIFVFAGIFLLTSVIGSLICLLLFQYVNKLSKANTIHYVICFAFVILGNLMLFGLPLGEGLTGHILMYINPVMIGVRGILSAGFIGEMIPLIGIGGMREALRDVAVLGGIAVLLAIVVGFSGRRQKL